MNGDIAHREQMKQQKKRHLHGYKKSQTLLLSVLAIGFSLLCAPQTSVALLGSDWSVKTPGGHRIYGGDCCERDGGVCLTGPENSSVYVSHIRRWRYDAGYVLGEREQGWFIFHEPSRQTQYFPDVLHWQETLNALQIGQSQSAWLTPKDGSWKNYGRWFVLLCLGYLAGFGIALSAVRMVCAPQSRGTLQKSFLNAEHRSLVP